MLNLTYKGMVMPQKTANRKSANGVCAVAAGIAAREQAEIYVQSSYFGYSIARFQPQRPHYVVKPDCTVFYADGV